MRDSNSPVFVEKATYIEASEKLVFYAYFLKEYFKEGGELTMKKIYAGLLSIAAVLVIVGVSAYALFTDKVTMSGMVLGTATPNLLMSLDNERWVSTSGVGDAFAPLLTGQTDWGEVYFQNTSDGTTDKVDMNLTARLTAAGGDWGILKDAIQMRVCVYATGTPGHHCNEGKATGWATLAYWNLNDVALMGSPLLQGATEHYVMEFFIPASYGNEIAGKNITGMSFEVTGTQVL